MPRFPVPEGEDENSWFVKEVERGLYVRYPDGVPGRGPRTCRLRGRDDPADGISRLLPRRRRPHQLGARRRASGSGPAAARRPARSSPTRWASPSSTRCAHGLLFERFLNPERVSMPDIDIDFDERRRGEVMATSPTSTAPTGSRRSSPTAPSRPSRRSRTPPACSATRSRWVSASPRRCRRRSWARTCRSTRSSTPKHERYGEGGEFRALCEADAEVKRVVETAQGLEGLKRQWGVHACAVIMSSQPLIDTIPIMKREQDGAIITQFDYPTCESLGLLKMDFLGLRNLTVIDDALANIQRNRGETVVIEDIGFDDPATYALLARGDTLGVFQLDGGPMRALLRSLRPDSFRRHHRRHRALPARADGRERAQRLRRPQERPQAGRCRSTPSSPKPLRESLGETYGLVVYQEQVMAIAQQVAGYSLGQRRPAAPRDGQEEEERTGGAVRELLRRHDRARVLRRPRSRRCGTSCCRSATTASTRATAPATPWCRTGPRTSRRTTQPSTWPRC